MRIKLDDGAVIDTDDHKYLMGDTDRHDNVRLYVRVKVEGKYRRQRLRDWSSFAAFKEEYRVAIAAPKVGKKSPPCAMPGSWRALVQQYYGSADFRGLGTETRRVRMRILDQINALIGDHSFSDMEKRHVIKLRDKKADTPAAANHRVKALRAVFKWAVDAGAAGTDPTQGVGNLASNNPLGHHTWTVEEVRQYEERHPIGTKARLAMAIGLFVGVRVSDAQQLGRQMERARDEMSPHGWLHFTEVKDRERKPKVRDLPILPELREVIDGTPSEHLTYLVTEYGKPFSVKGVGQWFRKRCDEAGLPHCSFHGLRKAGATIASESENGITELQLMAIYGWTKTDQAVLYTRAANRKRIAGEAMHLIVPEQKINETVPLPKAMGAGGTIRGKK